jgi:hypothetical protein
MWDIYDQALAISMTDANILGKKNIAGTVLN